MTRKLLPPDAVIFGLRVQIPSRIGSRLLPLLPDPVQVLVQSLEQVHEELLGILLTGDKVWVFKEIGSWMWGVFLSYNSDDDDDDDYLFDDVDNNNDGDDNDDDDNNNNNNNNNNNK